MYLGSENHKRNCLVAGELGRERKIELALIRQQEYDKDPKLCKFCNVALSYKEHKSKSFCNSSCAASFNNKGKVKSKESKRKASDKLKGRVSPYKGILRGFRCEGKEVGANSPVEFPTCKSCKRVFCSKVNNKSRKSCRKTCSNECRVQASIGVRTYQNGSRKPQWYFNKCENKEVLLDSSWEIEIAKLLDKKDIKWVRPKYIKWQDDNNKTRMYYPDFYLLDYNVYLDPKNPYCMIQGKRKMEIVSKQVSLVYGALEVIVKFINNLK